MNMMDWMGQTLGQYRIEAPLDAGGMGQVFRGMHAFLNRPAAIKVMRVNLADNPNFRARFLQEARSAAALKHPNIVEIYDFGDQDGHLYLVMELMTDGSLGSLLRRRVGGQPWPLSLGLDLARQAAEGLAEAHAQRMVHRDIKPDNLLLNRLKRAGQQSGAEQYQLKISDFGLARLAAGSGLTITGAPMGTLAYMSPEQCRGGHLDGRSDLYALGVVLYQVATGYLPFQISTFEEALQKHANVAPPPPRQVRSDVPPLLEEIILRCMAKRAEERFATGTELAQAIRRALGEEGLKTVAPISLPPPPPAEKTTLQSPTAGRTPAPVVSTLPGASTLLRVRVLDQSGQTIRVVEVTGYGLTVGRQSDSDIVLQGEAVSRQHLRVVWDGKQVTVTDLGSSNGTLLGDVRLLPQVSQVWMPRQIIRVGSFWLRLEGPSSQAFSSMPDGLSQTQLRGTISQRTSSQRAASLAGGGRIGVLMEPDVLIITPGQPAMAQVTLVNLGSIVDWFTVTAEGIPPEWVQGAGKEIQLNPGTEQTVVLNMSVTRTPNNYANEYPVTIRARSREKPEESGKAQGRWTVLPFKEDELRIEPRRVSGRGKANYAITLRNGGNTAAGYSLSGDDDEQKLAYRFGKNEVGLDPGKEEKVPLTVEARRHWLGREQRKPFQVHARPAGSSIPMTAQGEFVNKSLLPGWVMPVFLIATLGVSLIAGTTLKLFPWTGSVSPTPTIPAGPTVQIPTPDIQATAIAQANATATAIAQANATATIVAANPYPTYLPGYGTLALYDPLHQADYWPSGYGCTYSNGDFHVSAKPPNFESCDPSAPISLSNFALEVQMTIIQGQCGGILFRGYPSAEYYYFYLICQDGNYALYKYHSTSSNTSSITLTSGTDNASIVNKGLKQSNTIAIVAQGSTISLFVNSQQLAQVQDNSATTGTIALAVYSSAGNTDVIFSNLRAWML